ncbi:hypothetical protein MMC19_004216 [Ptychographa xylographoides]|nr:hypothetical protein [Ptychographa xylographoides]
MDTIALPAACSTCYPISAASSPRSSYKPTSPDFSSSRRPLSGGHGGFGMAEGDKCASCSMSLPDQVTEYPTLTGAKVSRERAPLRTREDVHACNPYLQSDEDGTYLHPLPQESFDSNNSDSSCHIHHLEYVSNSSPAESDTYSSLRRATIRTLSGEQLPRGQTSGPLWFGDPVAGYTIAYVFRLADTHARGRQRYYALLALAGSDTKRAFEACTMIWSFFEQIAMNIVEMAEDVASRSLMDDSPPKQGRVTPISSFLTGRTMDPDGYPRQGTANVRANGIAELVDNDRFFCELHMMFVGILQDLGRVLGGLMIRPEVFDGQDTEESQPAPRVHCGNQGNDRSPVVTTTVGTRLADGPHLMLPQCPASSYSPVLVTHRHQVVV